MSKLGNKKQLYVCVCIWKGTLSPQAGNLDKINNPFLLLLRSMHFMKTNYLKMYVTWDFIVFIIDGMHFSSYSFSTFDNSIN